MKPWKVHSQSIHLEISSMPGSASGLIEDKWGDTPIRLWSDRRMVRKIINWRDSRSATPRAAGNGILVLRTILNFARLRGEIAVNVAEKIPRLYRVGNRAEIVWTDEDIQAFLAKAHELGQPNIADGIRLAALTGLRWQDLVTLTWDQVLETTFRKKALKRSRAGGATSPCPDCLRLISCWQSSESGLASPASKLCSSTASAGSGPAMASAARSTGSVMKRASCTLMRRRVRGGANTSTTCVAHLLRS